VTVDALLDSVAVVDGASDGFLLQGLREAIYARGTAEDPVVFTSSQATPAPGDWNGIELLGGTPSDSVIKNAELRLGGKADGANLLVNAGKGTIRSSLFADSLGYGILVERDERFLGDRCRSGGGRRVMGVPAGFVGRR